MKCCICGNNIKTPRWAIRDYKKETYLQWVWRHIKTLFKIRSHRHQLSIPVCDSCHEMLLSSQIIIQEDSNNV